MVDKTDEKNFAVIPADETSLALVFQSDDRIEKVIHSIEVECESFVPDLTTKDGRKAIASLAYKVARSKTTLDGIGKQMNEDKQKAIDAVNEHRRKVRERLDALRDKVREPLNEWEAKEAIRIEKLKVTLEAMRYLDLNASSPSDDIADAITKLKKSDEEILSFDWGELLEQAAEIILTTIERLEAAHSASVEREANERELAELRAAAEKRAKEDAEKAEAERIEREAEEKRKAEAEAQAKAEAEAAEREAAKQAEIIEAAEQARIEAEEKAEAERIERDALAEQLKIETAEREAEAERRAAEAEERAAEAERKSAAEAAEAEERRKADAKAAEERQKQAELVAADRERQRIQAENDAADEARRRREADQKHRDKIVNDISDAITGMKKTEVAIAIIDGKIPHVKVVM